MLKRLEGTDAGECHGRRKTRIKWENSAEFESAIADAIERYVRKGKLPLFIRIFPEILTFLIFRFIMRIRLISA